MFTKGALKKYGVSVAITLAVIVIVFLVGPVAALVLSIDSIVVGPGTITFNLNFDIAPGELLPGGFTVTINGATCTFDSDANPLGGPLCPAISCQVVTKKSTVFGQFNANGVFDAYGYGYGYQYGYGYNDGELRYKCSYNYPCGQGGTATISFSTTVDGSTFTSPAHTVSLIPKPCGGSQSGGGAGGGAGNCCDPVVNFARWHCCQKAYIARIQCCAQPQHPDCAKYCKLLSCILPYVMDPLTGRCTLPSQNAPGTGTEGPGGHVPTPTPNNLEGGSSSTGQATQGGTGGTGGGSPFSSPWLWLFILLALLIAGFIYWRTRPRP